MAKETVARAYGLLMTTVGNREEAARIAQTLIDAKLAACVQLIPMESFYRWKGATANEAELLVFIKTRCALFDEAIATIKSLHPYETPEIVAMEFTAGQSDYFTWMDSVTK